MNAYYIISTCRCDKMIWILVLILVLTWIYSYSKRKLTYWQKRNVFTEKSVPVFGNVLDILLGKEHFLGFLIKIYNNLDAKYPYFGFYLFYKLLILKDRELIKEVLVKDFKIFGNRSTHNHAKIDPISANTLFFLNDFTWKNTRSKLVSMFTSGKLKLMVPRMGEIADDLENVLNESDSKIINIKNITKRFIIDITTKCAFGFDSGSLKHENSEIQKTTDKIIDQKPIIRRFATFCWVFFPFLVDFLRLPLVDMKSAYNFRDLYLQSETERRNSNLKRDDLIDLLIKISKEASNKGSFKFG